jgi:hypothetical protein
MTVGRALTGGFWLRLVLALIVVGFLSYAIVAVVVARAEVADALAQARAYREAEARDRVALRALNEESGRDRAEIHRLVGRLEARVALLEERLRISPDPEKP